MEEEGRAKRTELQVEVSGQDWKQSTACCHGGRGEVPGVEASRAAGVIHVAV